MKSFHATWRASNWGEDEPDGVTVYRPGEESWDHLISHERQIEDAIPDAPEELKSWVRKEVRANRPLAEDEVRSSGGTILKLSVSGEHLVVSSDNDRSVKWTRCELENPSGEYTRKQGWHAAALAYLDKHAPKLAENEVRDDKGMIWQLRWDCGVAECKLRERVAWNRCENMGSVPAALAWFRAHCPIDRFVTDEGEVLEFRMRDDGQAEAISGDFKRDQTAAEQTLDSENWSEVHRELLRFRDHERGKWTHKTVGGRFNVEGPNLSTYFPWAKGEWSELGIEEVPLWKRREVETLYREKNPEWRVEWRNDTSGGNAAVYQGRDYAGCFSKLGASTRVGTKTWPPHILTQARAKFRENYQLKRDEIWFQGMPVKMVFEGEMVHAKLTDESGIYWCENTTLPGWAVTPFAEESERLEAYDRMRRFYYEEHPGKALSSRGDVLTFSLNGTVGEARYYDGTFWGSLDRGVFLEQRERDILAKLQAWTAEQLKKREGEKVVFEGKWVSRKDDNTITLREITDKGRWSGECQRVARYRGSLRITIEPIGGE